MPPTCLLSNVLQAAAAEDAPAPLLADGKAEHSQGAVPDSTGSTGSGTRGEAAAVQHGGGSNGSDGGGGDAQQQASVTRYVVPMACGEREACSSSDGLYNQQKRSAHHMTPLWVGRAPWGVITHSGFNCHAAANGRQVQLLLRCASQLLMLLIIAARLCNSTSAPCNMLYSGICTAPAFES